MKGSSKKISYERHAYESVDDGSLSGYISKKDGEIIHALKRLKFEIMFKLSVKTFTGW